MKNFDWDKHKGKIIAGLLGLVVVVLFLIMALEPMLKNKLVIHNKSEHKVTKLLFWYEDESRTRSNTQEFTNVNSKEKLKTDSRLKIDKLGPNIWLTIQIAFEDGGEAILQASQLSNTFEGRLTLEIEDTKGEELMLKIRAGEGLFNSTRGTGCDVAYYINPKDGYIE